MPSCVVQNYEGKTDCVSHAFQSPVVNRSDGEGAAEIQARDVIRAGRCRVTKA